MRSGRLERWINRRPDKAHFTFRDGALLVPLPGRARGRRPLRADAALAVAAALRRGRSGWIAPAPLLARRLAGRVGRRSSGAEFGLRRRVDSPQEAAARDALLPPDRRPFRSPGRRSCPVRRDQRGTSSFPRAAGDAGPRRLDRAAASDRRPAGRGRLRHPAPHGGRGRTQPAGDHRRQPRARRSAARARALQGALTFSIGALCLSRAPRARRAPLRRSTSAKLGGEISRRSAAARAISRAPLARVRGHRRPLSTPRSRCAGGCSSTAAACTPRRPSRTLRFFGFEASGQALLDFSVRSDATGGHADLAVSFDDFELRRRAAGQAVVGGTGLSLLATTRDLRAGGLPDDASIRIDLGEARLLDLAGFSDLLPPSAALALAGGQGEVHGSLRGRARGGRCRFRARCSERPDHRSHPDLQRCPLHRRPSPSTCP